MLNLGVANELISRDEALHTEFGILLYTKYIKKKMTDKEMHKIIQDAVTSELQFVCEALPVALIGVNNATMSCYVKYVADTLLYSLGHPKIYHEQNPYEFMTLISLPSRDNFFEKRSSDYMHSSAVLTHESIDDIDLIDF